MLLLSRRVTVEVIEAGGKDTSRKRLTQVGHEERLIVSTIERARPERPPYVPAWVVPAVAALFAVLLLVVGLTLWLSMRSEVVVPDVVGVDEAVAKVRLAQAGLMIEVSERPFDASETGTVLDQDPAPGEALRDGESVSVVVSAGTEEFAMPDVVGLALRIAKTQLEDRGLTVRIQEVDSEAPENTVIATNPAPGATVRSTDMVRLSIAKKGDGADSLVPYKLEGTVIAIDPTPVAAGTQDATMEVARRLRSLLEASGASVIVTRSALDSATVSPENRAAEITGSVTAVIGLDVPSTGQPGLAVLTLSDSPKPAPSSTASKALADAIVDAFESAGMAASRDVLASDVVLSSAPNSPGVRVKLGSSASKSDALLFADPTWFDRVARAIYRGIGERVGAS